MNSVVEPVDWDALGHKFSCDKELADQMKCLRNIRRIL